MESPRNQGGSEEEYSSCESGWTMYIEDAFHGNDHSSLVVDNDVDVDDDDDGNDDGSEVKEAVDGDTSDDDEKSDDSMTSDASSGPSNQITKNINKHAAGKNGSKQLQKLQLREKTFSNQGQESELKARSRPSAASHVHSRGKVNKTQ